MGRGPGVGAVATQSLGNTAYGERGLDLIAQGATAEEALRIVMRTDTMLQDRQVGMVDAPGQRRELHRHDAPSTGPADGSVRPRAAGTSPAERGR